MKLTIKINHEQDSVDPGVACTEEEFKSFLSDLYDEGENEKIAESPKDSLCDALESFAINALKHDVTGPNNTNQ